MIVSGGDQNELREVFSQRGLAELFDGWIFGSPVTKTEILVRERASGNIEMPGVFLGDSKYDHRASMAADLDFLFLSDWSEMMKWQRWVEDLELNHGRSVQDFLT